MMKEILVALMAAMYALAWAAPEVAVSSRDVKDIEFDSARDGVYCPTCNGGAGNARFVHITKNGEVWVGNVDPATGDFVHKDGRGVLIDTNVCGPAVVGNGPEWMFSLRGSELVYTSYPSGGSCDNAQTRSLGFARFENGSWVAGPAAGTQFRQNPGGSLDLGDSSPTAVYTNVGRDKLYWRAIVGGAIENEIPLTYPPGSPVNRRFVPGTRKLLLTAPAAPGPDGKVYRQVFLYRMDTNELRQLTFDSIDKNGGFMWQAPEFQGRWVFFTVVDNRELRVYRKIDDTDGSAWEVIKSITTNDDMPYLGSPEYLTHNGKSWIYFWASSHPSRSNAPSRISMTGIEPGVPSMTVLASDAGSGYSRRDPEHFVTSQGPFIYYIRMRLKAPSSPMAYEGIYRVDTGLGPRIP